MIADLDRREPWANTGRDEPRDLRRQLAAKARGQGGAVDHASIDDPGFHGKTLG